jgi:hypothetical protein
LIFHLLAHPISERLSPARRSMGKIELLTIKKHDTTIGEDNESAYSV